MAFKTIYVTGAPASGKSSTLGLLQSKVADILLWEYGSRLTEYLQRQGSRLTDQAELREKSALIVRPADVETLDQELLQWTEQGRLRSHVLIDSHPVTKEQHGFRVTAFSSEKIQQLRPDEIWVFYTSPETTLNRIQQKAEGRPIITVEEARMHTQTQAAVATTYGVLCGCPVYMYDSDRDQMELVEMLMARLAK